jgi:hypothetical protein
MHSQNTTLDDISQPLGVPLRLTRFPDRRGLAKAEMNLSLHDLATWIKHQTADTKDGLPWIKLATFGTARTLKKSYRHNANVVTVTGIEADYDAGQMTPDDARAAMKAAGVAGLIYTTPSHTQDSPRWRVLAPLSGHLPPDAREDLMARLNGVLGGALDPASFTLSQAYYAGSVDGGGYIMIQRRTASV